jgi:hypothetical protein
MKLYLAARYERREEIAKIRVEGHEIVSRWLTGSHDSMDSADAAAEDLADVASADALVLFADPPGIFSRGGRHVEFGYALALGKEIWVVGGPENVFQHLPQVRRLPDAESLGRIPRGCPKCKGLGWEKRFDPDYGYTGPFDCLTCNGTGRAET